MSFAPPPPMFDDDDDKPYIHPATAHVGTTTTGRGGMPKSAGSFGSPDHQQSPKNRIECRLDHCRKVLQKVPIELYDLRSVARDGIPEQFRGTYWRLLLGFLPLRRDSWEKTRTESEATYQELLPSLLQIDPETNAPKVATSEHRIDVDIPRTIPSLHFFACADTKIVEGVPVTFSPNQQSLRRVLYLYAKCNPGLGYVQGMNEIVGHLLYAFANSHEDIPILRGDFSSPPHLARGGGGSRSAVSSPTVEKELMVSLGSTTEASQSEQVEETAAIVDTTTHMDKAAEEHTATAAHVSSLGEEVVVTNHRVAGGDGTSELVESDVFYCFQKLTAHVGDTFCRALDGDTTMGVTGAMTNFGVLVYCCDAELSEHLTSINLQPTFYAFRWITVLLTQEFLLPDVLRIWDFIFSFGNELRAALFFTCAAMLVLTRDKLLGMSFSEALPMLQSYPPPDDINQLLDLAEQLIATQGLDLLSKIQSGEVKIPDTEAEEEKAQAARDADFKMPSVDSTVQSIMGAFGRFRSGSKSE